MVYLTGVFGSYVCIVAIRISVTNRLYSIYTLGVGERSLDVVCTERSEFEAWITSLDALMNGFSDAEAVNACHGSVQKRAKSVKTSKKGLEIEFGALGEYSVVGTCLDIACVLNGIRMVVFIVSLYADTGNVVV